MSLIYSLVNIIDDSRREYEDILDTLRSIEAGNAEDFFEFKDTEQYGANSQGKNGVLVEGDNLSFMKWLIFKGYHKGDIKLIYVDPPFFSKADYDVQVKIYTNNSNKATAIKQIVYSDTWNEGIESYLKMICIRLFVMRDLLAEEGCIWMHLDWHVSHYVKILMDEVFGRDNFINEVIWNYKSGGTSNKRFARKHDTLLYYGKTKKYFFEAQKEKSYNRGFKPYRFKGVQEFQDERGWYTLVNMKDVWQMDMVGRTSSERTGYATQKPEALLERILTSCTEEGDLCADFFGGSGTLAVTAEKMNRRWITSDIGKNAIASIKKRLLGKGIESVDFLVMSEQVRLAKNQKFEVTSERALENQDLCRLTLHSYDMGKELLKGFGEAEQILLRSILAEDSLSLVDYWSADFNYDGEIHRPQQVKLREKDKLEEIIEGNSEAAKNGISVYCVDVFGNVSHKILW